jgi:hypothetical protein
MTLRRLHQLRQRDGYLLAILVVLRQPASVTATRWSSEPEIAASTNFGELED